MKHIKKKYAYEVMKLPIKKGGRSHTARRDDSKTLEVAETKDQIAFIKTTEDTHILSMFYKYEDKQIAIPIPDLTLVYYDIAYKNNIYRKEIQKQFFDKLNSSSEITEEVSNEIYEYIGYATTTIIQMFTTIESFMNSVIPDEGKYIRNQSNKNKVFDKKRIERYISFEEKLTLVLPYFHKKKYYKDKNEYKNSVIRKLKILRDAIIHTKSSILFEKQSELIKDMLDFDYDAALMEIRQFMNYFKPNYIENCDCGKDY